MKYTYALLIVLLLASCEPKLDRNDINSFKSVTKNYIEAKKYKSLIDLTDYNKINDTLGKLVFMANLYALDNMFENSKLSIIEKKSNHPSGRLDEYYEYEKISFIVQGDKDFYSFLGYLNKNENNEYYFSKINCINLSRECLKSKNQNYLPITIKLNNAYWRTTRNKKSFKEFTIRGENHSLNSIEKIVFRLKLKNLKGDEFFSKTITKTQSILEGDTFEFKIYDLEDYFVGYSLNKETFTFITELIEVLPKPINESCDLLEELNLTK